ncbi:hypothetical protein K488DRAFT_74742, partial [Vararia minispora EC-137]
MSTDAGPDKGKGRLVMPDPPTETSPLLAASSASLPRHDPDAVLPRRRSSARSLVSVFLATLAATLVVAALLALLAYSYAAEAARADDDALQRALVFAPPDRINVLNFTNGDISLEIRLRAGIDAGALVGVKESDDDSLARDLWKSLGRWGIRQLGAVTLTLSPVVLSSAAPDRAHLAALRLPPLALPLAADAPPGDAWLTPLTLVVHVRPTPDARAWLAFARAAWADGAASVRADVARVDLVAGLPRSHSWRAALRTSRADVSALIRQKLPVLPGLPPPGAGTPFPRAADLVQLVDFSIAPDPAAGALRIDATASLVSPVPHNLSLAVPRLPFIVSLPLALSANSTDPDPDDPPPLVPLAR